MRHGFMKVTSKFAYAGASDIFSNWAGEGGTGAQNQQQRNGSQFDQNNQQQQRGNNSQQRNDDGNNNDNGNDNSDDNTIMQDIWNEDEGGNKGGGNNNQNNNNQNNNNNNQNNQQQGASDNDVAAHLKKIGLSPLTLSEQDVESFKENPQPFIDQINTKIQSAYVQAMVGANQMVQRAVQQAVEKATNSSATLLRDDKARTALRQALPWAAKDEFAPLAETTLNRFLKKTNNDITRSITLTKLYFENQMKAMTPDGQQPNMNSQGTNRARGRASGTTDFSAILRGQK